MSVLVMGLVWKHSRAKGSDRLVLLAIADIAGDDGIAMPKWDTSIANLGRKTLLSERAVQYCVRNLQASGELAIVEGDGRGRASTFQILVDPTHGLFEGPAIAPPRQSKAKRQTQAQRLAALKESTEAVDKGGETGGGAKTAGVQTSAVKGCNPASERVQTLAPDPSVHHPSVSTPSAGARVPPAKKPPTLPPLITAYLAAGIPPAVRVWAEGKGWGALLELHWEHFGDYMRQSRNWKRYSDLNAAFRSCVRDDWGDIRMQAERRARVDARGNGARPIAPIDMASWWSTSDGVKAKGATLGMPYDAEGARRAFLDRCPVDKSRGADRPWTKDEVVMYGWRDYQVAVLDAAVEKEGWGAWVDSRRRQNDYAAVCRRRAWRGAPVPQGWEEEARA